MCGRWSCGVSFGDGAGRGALWGLSCGVVWCGTWGRCDAVRVVINGGAHPCGAWQTRAAHGLRPRSWTNTAERRLRATAPLLRDPTPGALPAHTIPYPRTKTGDQLSPVARNHHLPAPAGWGIRYHQANRQDPHSPPTARAGQLRPPQGRCNPPPPHPSSWRCIPSPFHPSTSGGRLR